jgi:hypothetical protein
MADVSPAPLAEPACMKSWRLSLGKSNITAIFWKSTGKGMGYLLPDTTMKRTYRRTRLGAADDRPPLADKMLAVCSLHSVDFPNLAEVGSEMAGRDWLARSRDEQFYFCNQCYPTLDLDRAQADGVLAHVALFCRSDVLLHEESPHHKAVVGGCVVPAISSDDHSFLKVAAALCHLHEVVLATIKTTIGKRARMDDKQ